MKISIVTVYNSINCGSYWQAYALGRAVQKLGHEVCYMEPPRNSQANSSLKYQVRTLLGSTLHFGPGAGLRFARCLHSFKKLHRGFERIRSADGADCFVLGSDTIWNFGVRRFWERRDHFLGKPFLPKKVFPYAAAAANTQLETFEKIDGVRDVIGKWSAIGVRDGHTRNVISALTDREVQLVCDPSLLLNKADYAGILAKQKPLPFGKKFVFLFLNRQLSAKQMQELRAYCDEKGYAIVKGRSWEKPAGVDYVCGTSPMDFLSCMYNAEFVVTDTFHGSAFSIRLEKQFAAIDTGMSKVSNLLQELGFADRLIGREAALAETLGSEIRYCERMDALNALQARSIAFLKDAIEG